MSRWLLLLVLGLVGCVQAAAPITPENQASGPAELAGTPTGSLQATVAPTAAAPGEGPMIEAMTVDLPNQGPAPELHNEVWLNTGQPLRLADLHGKVVLLEMWTFGCINCKHVIPSLIEWHGTYAEQGLVIIANHYPEFSYESELENLKEAIEEFEIPYAVAQDNDGATWRAYNNRFWPTLYLIDKQGNIRYQHIGEGAYTETEAAIRALLAEE